MTHAQHLQLAQWITAQLIDTFLAAGAHHAEAWPGFDEGQLAAALAHLRQELLRRSTPVHALAQALDRGEA